MDDMLRAFRELELSSRDHVLLFGLGHGVVEQSSLVNVFLIISLNLPPHKNTYLELGSVETVLDTLDLGLVVVPCAAWTGSGNGDSIVSVRVVRGTVSSRHGVHSTIALIVSEGTDRLVDGDMGEVDTDSGDLSVEVTEVTAGEKRVVAEIHTRNDVRRAESHLLDLGEIVDGISVQGKCSDVLDGYKILGDKLGGVQKVEVKLYNEPKIFDEIICQTTHLMLILFLNDLNPELPLRVSSSLNGIVQISTVEVGVLSIELEGLVPHQTVCTEMRSPVVLDEGTLSILVDQPEGVDCYVRADSDIHIGPNSPPKPCIILKLLGIARSERIHICIWVV